MLTWHTYPWFLLQFSHHNYGRSSLLPHHPPEVSKCLRQGALGGDVRILLPVAIDVVGVDVVAAYNAWNGQPRDITGVKICLNTYIRVTSLILSLNQSLLHESFKLWTSVTSLSIKKCALGPGLAVRWDIEKSVLEQPCPIWVCIQADNH